MEEKDFLNKMQNLHKPEVSADASQRQFRLALMNTRRSAAWGVWFLVVPIIFFCCVAIKYLLHWNWGIAGNFLDWMANVDKSMSLPIVTIVLFIVLPAVGAVINLLAILHFIYDKPGRQLLVTIKIKWLNIILAAISICMIGIVLVYAIAENSAERAVKKYSVESRSNK